MLIHDPFFSRGQFYADRREETRYSDKTQTHMENQNTHTYSRANVYNQMDTQSKTRIRRRIDRVDP